MANDERWEQLYQRLERLGQLDDRARSKTRLVIGDENVLEYHRLLESLPVLSGEELRKYHAYVKKKTNMLRSIADTTRDESR